MSLPIKRPFPPMEALLVKEVPTGKDWQYEPKWDGFRCIDRTLTKNPGHFHGFEVAF